MVNKWLPIPSRAYAHRPRTCSCIAAMGQVSSAESSTEANRVTAAREAIAYHEAGHAVVSMKLGYKCLYVTIIPDGDRLGHVCCEDPLAGGHDDKIKHALKVLIAASLAERKHIGSPTWGDADDRVKATNLALLASDRDTERAEVLVNEMIGEARKLVEQYWPDIEALAERLLIKGRVNFLDTDVGASKGYW